MPWIYKQNAIHHCTSKNLKRELSQKGTRLLTRSQTLSLSSLTATPAAANKKRKHRRK